MFGNICNFYTYYFENCEVKQLKILFNASKQIIATENNTFKI